MLNVEQLMGECVWAWREVETVEKRFEILEHYIAALEFDAVIYTFVPTVSLGNQSLHPARFHSDSFPKPFLRDYVTEQWERSDFTVRYIKEQHKQVMDWQEHMLSSSLREDEKNLIERARHDYGITHAVSIPLLCNGLGGAGASVVSWENETGF